MKIFNRGNDNKSPALPAGPAALAAPGVAAAPPSAPAAPAEPAQPPAPDLTLILDANVKEMSEKIAHLASTLESSSSERGSFEAKLEQMEERMRKLSSLTEMISAQYNPFVGEAPTEREPLPRPEIGLAPPADAGIAAPPPSPPAIGISLPDPPAPLEAYAELPPSVLEEPPQATFARAPEPLPERGVLLDEIAPGFESSMLLLGWSDMLLKSVGSREALLDLANYYHQIGWIGDDARGKLLAYADGLAQPEDAPRGDWRADVQVHEKSLLFVEKLRAVSGRRTP